MMLVNRREQKGLRPMHVLDTINWKRSARLERYAPLNTEARLDGILFVQVELV
jgi:hypothetical protein